jgi:hypothetical protein
LSRLVRKNGRFPILHAFPYPLRHCSTYLSTLETEGLHATPLSLFKQIAKKTKNKKPPNIFLSVYFYVLKIFKKILFFLDLK